MSLLLFDSIHTQAYIFDKEVEQLQKRREDVHRKTAHSTVATPCCN